MAAKTGKPGDFLITSAGDTFALLWSLAVGVGNHETAGADVWGTDIRSSYLQNPDFVTFGFKVFVYLPELRNTGESGNILSNNPRWVGFPNKSKVLWPQPPFIFTAEPFSGKADGLTRESA